MPADSLDAVLNNKGQYIKVIDELAKLIDSSNLGRLLLEPAMTHVASDKLAIIITKHLTRFFMKAETISTERLDEAIRECLKECSESKAIELLNGMARDVQCKYRGVELKLSINSIRDEVTCKFACAVKTLAVNQETLPKMQFEDLIVEGLKKKEENYKMQVPSNFLSDAKDARKMLADELQSKSVGTADELLQAIRGCKNHQTIY